MTTYHPGDRVTIRTAYGDAVGTVRELYLPGPPTAVYAVEADGFPRLLVLEVRLSPAADGADVPHLVTAPH